MNSVRPFFSIIIPSFNAAKTIASCLDSIIHQTFQDWEVLIMDGLSGDNTVEIINNYCIAYPSIKLISQKDNGIYDAMNKGLGKVEGKWIYFLGSDDSFFDNEVLTKIFHVINENDGIDVLYGNVMSERFHGLYDGEFDAKKIRKKNISHQAIFFKKEIFQKTGLYNLEYKAQADWDHNLKWFLSGEIKKLFMPITIANYADGGFSSEKGDPVFYADLNFNYIKYASSGMTRFQKARLLLFEFFKSVKRMEIDRTKKVIKSLKYL